MAEKRMFSKKITESDSFLDMPMSSQCLYFHLCQNADDEGFVNSPKSIQRKVGASLDDLKILLAKKFIIGFESGVVVIKHWRIHNYIQSDRFHPTDYVEEKSQLIINDNKSYSLSVSDLDTTCIQNVSSDKNRLDIDKSIDNNICPPKADYSSQISEVINHLNQVTGKSYKVSAKANRQLITSRLKDGYTVEDLKKVIDVKAKEWMRTEQEKYLRPETLFTPSHVESYLNQKNVKKRSSNNFLNFEQHEYDFEELTKRFLSDDDDDKKTWKRDGYDIKELTRRAKE